MNSIPPWCLELSVEENICKLLYWVVWWPVKLVSVITYMLIFMVEMVFSTSYRLSFHIMFVLHVEIFSPLPDPSVHLLHLNLSRVMWWGLMLFCYCELDDEFKPEEFLLVIIWLLSEDSISEYVTVDFGYISPVVTSSTSTVCSVILLFLSLDLDIFFRKTLIHWGFLFDDVLIWFYLYWV